MSEELENKNESLSAGQNDVSREAYKQTEGFNNQSGNKPMRPRIKVQRAYAPNRSYNKDDGGFRPEGFGAGLQQQGGAQRPYRPRYNADRQGGYQPRQDGYQQRQPGYRPNYNTHATARMPRAAISPVRASTASSGRPATVRATTPIRAKGAISPVRAATSAADISVAAMDSSVRAATSAAATTASARPTTIPTQSTALRNA